MQKVIVAIVLVLCVAYAAWRCYCIMFRKTNPCEGCQGCELKSEGGCLSECHCPQGHGMLEDELPGVEEKARAAAKTVESVSCDGHS